jgi:hypothetical protein
MVALSICVFTVVKIYSAPDAPPVSQLTPASAITSPDRQPSLPELSAQTRRQLEAPPAGMPAIPPAPSGVLAGEGGASTDTSRDGGTADGRTPDQTSSHGSPSHGPLTRWPSVQGTGPGRTVTPPVPVQRPGTATRPDGRVANRSGTTGNPDAAKSPDAAESPGAVAEPDSVAPAEEPEPVYVRPETPAERDARMRRELADSVCDQYGVQREACRARAAHR